MKRTLIAPLTAVALAVGGCADMTETQRGTAIGTGIGAATGAVIGKATGDGDRDRAVKGAVIGGIAGAVAGNVWSKRMEAQKRQMEQATTGTGVEVSQTPDNRLKLEIPSDISFATGRADIEPNFRTVLNRFATSLQDNPGTMVTIMGHTDSTGSDAINNALSLNRADAVRDYLVARGVSPNRINIDGRGSREPIASNNTAAGRAANRRVEIFVAEPQA
jgi:outer membrane protein OmpA-like peptidoglycan-associated protein